MTTEADHPTTIMAHRVTTEVMIDSPEEAGTDLQQETEDSVLADLQMDTIVNLTEEMISEDPTRTGGKETIDILADINFHLTKY